NSESKTSILLSVQHLIDVFQTVMTSITSLCFDSDSPKRKVQIIGYYQKIFQRNFLFLQPILNGFSTQIHIGIGFQQKKLPSFEFIVCQSSEFYGLKI